MENKTPKTNEMIQHMLDSLEKPVKTLNYWENNFVASISTQFERGVEITDRQFETLEKLYAEKTA